MGAVKDAVDDYIFAFRMKSRAGKIRAIRTFVFRLLIVAGLICSPAIIARMDTALERDLSTRVMPTLTDEQKWDLVRQGRMRIACADDADDKIKAAGLDPSSAEGIEYAIDHGICDFALNQ